MFYLFIYILTLHSPYFSVNKIKKAIKADRASKHAKHFAFNTKSLKPELNILKQLS